MSWLSDLLGGLTGQPAKQAAQQNAQLYQQNYNTGLSQLAGARDQAAGAIGSAVGAYDPLSQMARLLGDQYGGAFGAYGDALGLNGADGASRARGAFKAGPGSEWMRDQALEGSTRGAAARSMGSLGGNQLSALSRLGSGLADQEWGSHLGRLAGLQSELGGRALAGTGAVAGGVAGQYGNLANIYNQFGTNAANLGTTTASGQANSNMQSAQAQQQGAANLANLGLGAMTTAAGLPWGKIGGALGGLGYSAYGATQPQGGGSRVGPFPY
jgi:hypothetical protein